MEKRPIKLLVLSSTPWSDDNSFGNSFSAIFEGIEDIEVANIACRPGRPTSYLVTRYFQITEKALLSNLKNKKHTTGKEILLSQSEENADFKENLKARRFGQKKRWQILFWAQDMIWALGRWKSPELKAFIDSYHPDLIFQPVYYSSHMNDIAQYIKEYTGVPMLGYISDDCYTLKQWSLSPLYWIDRLYKRRKVKKTVELCELLYVISDIQKEDYEKCFTTRCKILTKGADFSDLPEKKAQYNSPLQLVFTGNIGTNRWKSLGLLAKVLEKINGNDIKAQLRIYSATPLTEKMKKVLCRGETSFFMGRIPAEQVDAVQKDADILVHAEGLDRKSRLFVRQSFSTKLVDYLKSGRPILAVGPKDVASIDYLIRNRCAIVADNGSELEQKLTEMLADRTVLDAVTEHAYACGKENHSKQNIQTMVKNDLKVALEKR